MFNNLFTVDPTSPSGLVWKNSGKPSRNGKQAGYAQYRKDKSPKCFRVEVGNKSYSVHRVIWEIVYGSIPEDLEVDHIDGNPFNNAISNLRIVPHKINARNQRMSSANKTGVTGTYIKDDLYVTAHWRTLDGKLNEKNFSISKLGLDVALEHAKVHRETEISRLNQQGAGYTYRHGQGE